MTNREKALELADTAIERIEAGSTMPDTPDLMAYALVLALADIGEQLEKVEDTLSLIHDAACWSIRQDGVGVG